MNRCRTNRWTRAAGACFASTVCKSKLPLPRGRVNSAVMLLPFHYRMALCMPLIFASATVAHPQQQTLADWIGKTPVVVKSKPRRSIYNSPVLKPRLIKLLGKRRYLHLANFYYTMSPIKNVDGYLLAFMCQHHFCPHNSSFMAVDPTEGDIHVASLVPTLNGFTKGKSKRPSSRCAVSTVVMYRRLLLRTLSRKRNAQHKNRWTRGSIASFSTSLVDFLVSCWRSPASTQTLGRLKGRLL